VLSGFFATLDPSGLNSIAARAAFCRVVAAYICRFPNHDRPASTRLAEVEIGRLHLASGNAIPPVPRR
jgi:hypothetical protein